MKLYLQDDSHPLPETDNPTTLYLKDMQEVVSPATTFSRETYLHWFEVMYRIREFEMRSRRLYIDKKIRGFCHLYIGQEAIAAGMLTATRQTDPWITAYRQHGTAIAKGISTAACMAELYGKVGGNVRGKGGSMHFFSKELCYFGGDGIVGGQIATGAGLAFAEKYRGTDNVCITMFGDGAARQGILHESFNMAMTWKLPVVFICENNYYAMGTSVERTSNVTDIFKLGLGYDMPSAQVDGMSCESVHDAIHAAVEHARAGNGPTFLEILTYRYQGHSMSDPAKYRTKEELLGYQNQDPIIDVRNTLLENQFASEEEIVAIEERIKKEIDEAVEFAENSPFPPAEELWKDNYVQADYPFIS